MACRIADKVRLTSRYVKDWLGVMVTGSDLEVLPGENRESRFHLPKAMQIFLLDEPLSPTLRCRAGGRSAHGMGYGTCDADAMRCCSMSSFHLSLVANELPFPVGPAPGVGLESEAFRK
jgi:hypothetical protein